MRLIHALLTIVILAMPTHAQDVLRPGKQTSPKELQAAKDLLELSKGNPTTLKVGGYCFVELEVDQVLNWYVPPGSQDLLKRVKMNKGETYEGWLVPKGKTAFEYVTLAASEKPRYRLMATQPGQAQLMIFANGATPTDPPVCIAAYSFIIEGDSPIDPVTPVKPLGDLAKLAEVDIKASKGTVESLKAYRAWYVTVAGSVEASTNFQTYGDFYKSLSEGAEKLAGPYDKVLPTMRAEITKILTTELGGNMGDPFPVETRRKVAAVLANLALRMEGF